ncbi:MAG: glutathione S-transferase family protein [Solirubrobacteraceae bacterium]
MLTLYTFPPSLDSEFSRFVLQHYGVSADEERHVIPFQSVVTLVRAGTPRIPTLHGEGVRLDTIEKIINHLELQAAPDRRLVGGPVPQAVAEDWRLLHHVLNTATTVFAYYHLLPRRDLMVNGLAEGAPAWEVTAVDRAYPAFAGLFRLLLRLTHARAAQAEQTIRTTMDTIDRRLADGRPYLNGDRFTLADMAFAVVSAPVVWPEGYGGPLPPLDAIPAAIRDLVMELRARPCGGHALRIYREYR